MTSRSLNDVAPSLAKQGSNHICDFRPISVAYLVSFLENKVLVENDGTVLMQVVRQESDNYLRIGRAVERTKNNHVLLEFPYCSNRFSFPDEDLKRLSREEWTTENVVEWIIKRNERVINERLFYIDLVFEVDPEAVGAEYQGYFVSQARSSNFMSMIHTFEHYWERKDLRKCFVWLDMFSANQPLLCDGTVAAEIAQERKYILSQGLHEGISQFDGVLLYLESLDNPRPINRSWCVWEIFGAVSSDRPLQVLLTTDQYHHMRESLIASSSKLRHKMSEIDVKKSNCRSLEDKQEIELAIKKRFGPNGFSFLNEIVIKHLRLWLAKAIQKIVKKERNESTSDSENLGMLLVNAGRFVLAEGMVDEGRVMFNDALEVFKGNASKRAYVLVHGLCRLHVDLGEYEHCIEISKKAMDLVEGSDEPTDLLTTSLALQRTAFAQLRLKDVEAALRTARRGLEIKKSLVGRSVNQEELTQLIGNNGSLVGMILDEMNQPKEALVYHLETLLIRKRTLGERSSYIASSFKNIGVCHLQADDYTQALDFFNQSLVLRTEIFGEVHPNVAEVLYYIGLTFGKSQNKELAQEYLKRAKDIQGITIGTEHANYRRTIEAESIFEDVAKTPGK